MSAGIRAFLQLKFEKTWWMWYKIVLLQKDTLETHIWHIPSLSAPPFWQSMLNEILFLREKSGAFFVNRYLSQILPLVLLSLALSLSIPLLHKKNKSAIRCSSINSHLCEKRRKDHFHNKNTQAKQIATRVDSHCTNWPGWWACSCFIFYSFFPLFLLLPPFPTIA